MYYMTYYMTPKAKIGCPCFDVAYQKLRNLKHGHYYSVQVPCIRPSTHFTCAFPCFSLKISLTPLSTFPVIPLITTTPHSVLASLDNSLTRRRDCSPEFYQAHLYLIYNDYTPPNTHTHTNTGAKH